MILPLADLFIKVAEYIISVYLVCVYMHQTTLDRIIAAVILTHASVEAHHKYR